MWILINNIPVNTLEICGDLSIRYMDPATMHCCINKNEKPYYFFKIGVKNCSAPIRSTKKYATKEEALEARNSVLQYINQQLSLLPTITI